MKKILLIAGVVVLLVIVGVAVAVRMLIDPERVRSAIETQATAAIGMPVTLQAAAVSVWPRARVTLSGLKVGEPASVSLDRIEIATALGALLSRRIENAELTISDSTIDLPALLAALDGLAKEPPPPPANSTPAEAPLTLVSVDTIVFRNVRVIYNGDAATITLESALNGDRLDIRSFDLASNFTDLTATGVIESLAGRRGKLTIDAASLDLDAMVAQLATLQRPQAAPQQAAVPAAAFDMTFDVTAAKGRTGGVQFDNLKTSIHATADAIELAPFGFGAFAGRVEGKARIDTTRAEPVLVLDAQFSQMDAGAVAAFTGHPGTISGRLAGELHVSGAGVEPATALANATGSGALTISDGVIPNLHLVRALVVAFGRPEPGSSGGGDRFTRIAATMQLGKGLLRFSTFTFASPDVDVDGSGTLNLSAGVVDVAGRAQLSEALTAQAGRDLVRYTADNKRVTVPVTVTGAIGAPHVRVDVAALLRRAAENEFKSQIQKLFKKKP